MGFVRACISEKERDEAKLEDGNGKWMENELTAVTGSSSKKNEDEWGKRRNHIVETLTETK